MQQNLRYLIAFLIFLVFFQMGAIERVIARLNLSQAELAIGMGLAMIASLVAIQLFTFRYHPDDRNEVDNDSFPARQPPHIKQQPSTQQQSDKALPPSPTFDISIGFNFGGVLIPLFFILYFSRNISFDFFPLALLILAVTTVVYPLTRIEKRTGAVVYLFGAVVVAAVGALILGGENYLIWAYTGAVLGTLIGGDLLHLPQLRDLVTRTRGPI
ncbi:MAG: DUF1614 domain-containing protein, partial [Marinobacterium sp.]|nr:DUF1614 domain-containing protein [Marinobacterium sp.]